MICKFIIYNWAHENRIYDFAEEQKISLNEEIYEEDIFAKAEVLLNAGFNIMIRHTNSCKFPFVLYVDTERFTQR